MHVPLLEVTGFCKKKLFYVKRQFSLFMSAVRLPQCPRCNKRQLISRTERLSEIQEMAVRGCTRLVVCPVGDKVYWICPRKAALLLPIVKGG